MYVCMYVCCIIVEINVYQTCIPYHYISYAYDVMHMCWYMYTVYLPNPLTTQPTYPHNLSHRNLSHHISTPQEIMHHDPNTYVSYLEFLAAVLLKRVVIDDDRLELAFCSMDVESSGLLHRGTFR